MKTCTKCKIIMTCSSFSKDKNRKDKLYSSCKQCKAKVNKKFYNNNIDSQKKRCRDKYKNNKNKYLERSKQYNKENPIKRKAWKAKRRAVKLNATLSGYDKEILNIYKKCPNGYHVDHIIPLQGKGVCGLHAPWNLQYLTAEENLKKSNNY